MAHIGTNIASLTEHNRHLKQYSQTSIEPKIVLCTIKNLRTIDQKQNQPSSYGSNYHIFVSVQILPKSLFGWPKKHGKTPCFIIFYWGLLTSRLIHRNTVKIETSKNRVNIHRILEKVLIFYWIFEFCNQIRKPGVFPGTPQAPLSS